MPRYTYFIPFFALAVCVMIAPARALAEEKLTEDNIRAFVEKTTVITSGKESAMSGEEIAAYLDAHLHPDARFKSTMRYAIPGFDVQVKIMSVDKEDFIEGINHTASTMDNYESQIIISDIKISKDGRKATLKTKTHESGMMPVADETGKDEVPVEGMSTCTQILMLSKEENIQMYNATCITDIQFDTFAP
ncbi:MAG: hypothetical protein WBK55_05640 [Alphaproteobacteria bacterium]